MPSCTALTETPWLDWLPSCLPSLIEFHHLIRKDLADIVMALTTGQSLQTTSVQGPLRKGVISEAILLVLGLDSIEGDG
jgi:hypothetical protein